MIPEKQFTILVKAGKKQNKFLGYDAEKKAYRIEIKVKAEHGKANREVIKLLSKLLRRKVSIIRGLKSREKQIATE